MATKDNTYDTYFDSATQSNVTIRKGTLFRLEHDQYLELSRKFSTPFVNNETSALQAGYQLGVQAVLQALREGFVIEDHQS